MSHRCAHCQSMFFKTLETRLLGGIILYKKRCKRCKFKYLLKKEAEGTQLLPANRDEWLSGQKVTLGDGKTSERAKVFISEYSGRISRAAEDHTAYLKRLRHAEGIHHEQPPAVN